MLTFHGCPINMQKIDFKSFAKLPKTNINDIYNAHVLKKDVEITLAKIVHMLTRGVLQIVQVNHSECFIVATSALTTSEEFHTYLTNLFSILYNGNIDDVFHIKICLRPGDNLYVIKF